jgi:hypothetical protein
LLRIGNASNLTMPGARQTERFDQHTLVIRRMSVHYWHNSPGSGVGGIMDELIGRLVDTIGVDRAAAEKAVGIILDFLIKEGPADKVHEFLAKLPGAEALALKVAGDDAGGMGGVMGAGMRMMSAGLSMGQVQNVAREVIGYARDKAGEDAVGEIVGAVPGLAEFV